MIRRIHAASAAIVLMLVSVPLRASEDDATETRPTPVKATWTAQDIQIEFDSNPVDLRDYPVRPGQPWPRFVGTISLPYYFFDNTIHRSAVARSDMAASNVRTGRPQPVQVMTESFLYNLAEPIETTMMDTQRNLGRRSRSPQTDQHFEVVSGVKSGFDWLSASKNLSREQADFMRSAVWIKIDRARGTPNSGFVVTLYALTEPDARILIAMVKETIDRVYQHYYNQNWEVYESRVESIRSALKDIEAVTAERDRIQARIKRLDETVFRIAEPKTIRDETHKHLWLLEVRTAGLQAKIEAGRAQLESTDEPGVAGRIRLLLAEWDIELLGLLTERALVQERHGRAEERIKLGDELTKIQRSASFSAAQQLPSLLDNPPRPERFEWETARVQPVMLESTDE